MNSLTYTDYLVSRLTEREKEIAESIAWGKITKEVADKMNLSTGTVTVHLKHIYRKWNIHKETDLTRIWIFHQYCITDHPIKKIVATCFLALVFSTIIFLEYTPRYQNSRSLKTAEMRSGRKGGNRIEDYELYTDL